MKHRRLLCCALACSALFSLAACGPSQEPETPPDEGTTPPQEEVDESTPVYNDWAEDGELRILAIGNSFSDDTLEYAYNVAAGFGIKKITIGNLFIGGCSINMHLLNAFNNSASYKFRYNDSGKWNYDLLGNTTLETGLKYREWDYISLQPGTGDGSRLTVASSLDNLDTFVEYVRGIVGDGPRLVWNMFWSDDEPSRIPDFLAYNSDPLAEYNAIAKTTKEVVYPKKAFSLVSPLGTAIQNVRSTFIAKTRQLTNANDGHHLNIPLGRYIAAVTHICALTGYNPAECNYKLDGLTASEYAAIVECVTNALAHPFEMTPSVFSGE